jgi:hypothetical protein
MGTSRIWTPEPSYKGGASCSAIFVTEMLATKERKVAKKFRFLRLRASLRLRF